MDLDTTVIIGYQKEQVKQTLINAYSEKINFVEQKEQLGTGHAILCSQEKWNNENILIMNGDVPLITQEIIEKLYEKHIKTDAAISFITSHIIDINNRSYGRVVKNKDKSIEIIEACELDAKKSTEECCINAGIYIVKKEFLEHHASILEKNKTKKEFFITDLVKIASETKINCKHSQCTI